MATALGEQHETERRMHRQRRQRDVDHLREADAEQQPEYAAERRQRHRLAEEKQQDGSPRRAERDQQADFTGALGHRDGHDGDDADAADEQRDAAERADRHGQHVEDVGQGRHHFFLGDDGEILPSVPRHHALAHGGGNNRRRHALVGRQVDLVEALAVEYLERPRRRNEGGIVEVDAEELALGLEHPDDAELVGADTQAGAERILRAEQFLLELRPEDDQSARAVGILRRQELAGAHPPLEHLQHLRPNPVDRGAAHASVAADLGVAPDAGRHGDDVRQVGERPRVVERQRPRAARKARRMAAGLGLALMHADDVGAELAELGQHEAVDALADRGQQDHRGDTDGDAEERQEAAQPLRGDGAQRELEGVGEDHG